MTGEDFPIESNTDSNEALDTTIVDVRLDEVEGGSRTPWAMLAGAGILVLALGAGLLALSGSDSETETAQSQAAEQTEEESDPGDVTTTTAAQDGADDGNTATTAPASSDSADVAIATTVPPRGAAEEAMEDEGFATDFAVPAYGGGITNAVFDGEQFVALTQDESGWLLRTSVDGLDWDETPVTGIPLEGYMNWLQLEGSTFVGMLDTYSGQGSSQSLVSSTDGISWTKVALPKSDAGDDASVSGLAVLNGEAVMIRTIYDNSNDPYELLMDAGILTHSQFDSFCGFDYSDEGEPISVLSCNYDDYEENYEEPDPAVIDELAARYDAATTDEERDAITDELDDLWNANSNEEVLATINPGDPLYDAISESVFGQADGGGMTTEVVSGPLAGPFAVVGELPSNGYTGNLVQTNSALFVTLDSYDDGSGDSSSILTSTDGVSWTEVSSSPADFGGELYAFGDTLLFSGHSYESQNNNFISTDGAKSWVESSLETELFESYTQFTSSDAGVVAIIMGGVEPYQDPYTEQFGPDENPVLEKDGYTLEVPWTSGEFILTGPDGAVISQFGEEEVWNPDNDLVRENPINGTLTFLDPTTGVDLVSFGQDDWEAIYGSFEDDFDEEEWVEPEQGVEVWFSVNGVSWTPLNDPALDNVGFESYVSPVGVSDDGVVLSVTTWDEPSEEIFAFEAEGREPTEAEIRAIELFENSGESISYVSIPLPS